VPIVANRVISELACHAIIARLEPGAEDRAAELLESGPPFDPAELGFERHIW